MGVWVDLCLDWKTLTLFLNNLHAITMVSTVGKYDGHVQYRGMDRDAMSTHYRTCNEANYPLMQNVDHAFLHLCQVLLCCHTENTEVHVPFSR